jgi:hypothetical protein
VALVVNLEEFAELCGVTGETMRGHIRGVEDSPAWLIERGDRGRGYKIEPEGGLVWWRAKRDQADADAAEHKEALAQLRLDILGDQGEDGDLLTLSGKQRREEYAATIDRIKLQRMMGELVEAAQVETALTHAAVEARRRFGLIAGEYAAEAGLSPEEVKPLAILIERAVGEFVDKIASAGGA